MTTESKPDRIADIVGKGIQISVDTAGRLLFEMLLKAARERGQPDVVAFLLPFAEAWKDSSK